MNKTLKNAIASILILIMCFAAASCTMEKSGEDNLWKDALYTEDISLGKGDKTFSLEVKAGDKSITFTINTDADNLEDALTECSLIEGEEGPYGIYIKKVNGITADYDVDQSYWSISENGEPLMSGASGVNISGGEYFEFVRTR